MQGFFKFNSLPCLTIVLLQAFVRQGHAREFESCKVLTSVVDTDPNRIHIGTVNRGQIRCKSCKIRNSEIQTDQKFLPVSLFSNSFNKKNNNK